MSFRSFGPIFFCVISLVVPALPAAEWHVSGAGDDAHSGTSAAAAFRSLQKAAGVVQPGDTVLVGEGIYTNGDTAKDSAILNITRSGREDAWITWKAAPGAHPELKPIGWNGILLQASYNVIDGFTVTGVNDSLVLSQALTDGLIKEKAGEKYAGDPRYNTNGIFVTGRSCAPDAKPHHNIVRRCTVSKCPGGGIIGIETDYLTIEDNLVFENAWFMRYGGSGISTLNNWAHDKAPGYHVIIQRNRVWNNRTYVPWNVVARLSDGNGIILDVTDTKAEGDTNPNADAAVKKPGAANATPTPDPVARPEWPGRTLVANNLSAYNGGSGIHAFRHAHADIINNTTYWNGNNVPYAEMFAGSSTDIVFLNNINVPRPGGKVTTTGKNNDVRWDYNLSPETQSVLRGSHDLAGDPRFIKVARDLRDADFRLQPESPALDSGTDELAQPKDVSGQPRPAGKGRDRGAFEQ